MATKKINYLSRDFAAIKEELVKFSNMYYPELADDFNDSSVGAWFIDLVSAVGDDLSYHTDRMYQETNIDSANLKSTVLNQARSNGLKIPGRKASTCEIELSCVLPTNVNNISSPDWNYAPIVQKTSIVSAGNNNFQLTEDVNFNEQFNSNGFSNRRFSPARDGNGNITGYTVTKSTIVTNGTTKVYKKIISSADLSPFMEVVLPEANVMNVESIIFKESSDITSSPKTYEYYIDKEEFKLSEDAIMTYRFFECDSLADQWRFGDKVTEGMVIDNMYNPSIYEDEQSEAENGCSAVTRYYRGEWKPLRQKFITEYTDNGFLKIIFGAGNSYADVPDKNTTYGKYIASNIINNDMLGVLPKEGWTMFVLYRIGGGTASNLGPGAINRITLANVDWGANTGSTDGRIRGQVLTSLTVNNISTALGGKDEPSVDEIKYLMKYNTSAQNRAVSISDYKVKLMQMPPKYGAPFRCSVIETNNKVEMDLLGLDVNGHLTSQLSNVLTDNIVEYMSHFKQINDYIEIKSGRIYDIAVEVDVYVDKNYDAGDVVSLIINKIVEYFDVNSHEMGEDIFVGDLQKEINILDGVVSIIKLRVYKVWNGSYHDESPLPTINDSDPCSNQSGGGMFVPTEGAEAAEVDLDACEMVLYSDYNAMYQILNPSSDVMVRVKQV